MFSQPKLATKMNKWYLLGSIVLLAACSSNRSSQLEINDDPLILGTASPILLDLQSTRILLSDYILEPQRLDSVTSDGPFELEIDNSVLRVEGRPQKPVYNLTFWSKGIGESVLLKRTKKTLHSFVFMGDGAY